MKSIAGVSLTVMLIAANSFGFPPILSLLGTGFDKLSKTEKLRCVDANGVIHRSFNEKPSYSIKNVTTLDELKRALGVEVQASLGMGIYQDNHKVNYLHSGKFNSYDSFVIVRVESKSQAEELNEYKMTDRALWFLAEGDAKAFHQSCGSEFVVSRTIGRELVAILAFQPNAPHERDLVRETVHQNRVSFQSNGEFSEQMMSLATLMSYKIIVFQRGAPRADISLESLSKDIKSFSEQTSVSKENHPWAIQATTMPYHYTENFPKISFNLNHFENQNSFLDELAEIIDKLLMNKGNIWFIIRNQIDLFNGSFEDWDHLRISNERDLFRVKDLVRACLKNPERDCHFGNEGFAIPQLALPRENSSILQGIDCYSCLSRQSSEDRPKRSRKVTEKNHGNQFEDECCLM